MAKIKIRNLRRDINQRVRVVKTATSGGTGIGDQTGAIFENAQEIGFCLSPDSILTDVVAFPKDKAEMDAFLASNPLPNLVSIFESDKTVVTKNSILVDFPDISKLNTADGTFYFGWSFNKDQLDKCILLNDDTAKYGTMGTWTGGANEEPVIVNQELTLAILKQIAQNSIVFNNRYISLNNFNVREVKYVEETEFELKDSNGPYGPVQMNTLVRLGYATATKLVIGPKTSEEFESVKDKIMNPPLGPDMFLLNPFDLTTVVDAESNTSNITGISDRPDGRGGFVGTFVRANKAQMDAVVSSGLPDDTVVGKYASVRQDPNGANFETPLTVAAIKQLASSTVDGDDYILPIVIDSDLWNSGKWDFTLNLTNKDVVLKETVATCTFDFKLKAELDMQTWPSTEEEFDKWVRNHGISYPTNYVNPFKLNRTVEVKPDHTEITYTDVPRLHIGKSIPEGFKIYNQRINEFMAYHKDAPDTIMGVFKYTKPNGTTENTNLTIDVFRSLWADGKIVVIDDYFIFQELLVIPDNAANTAGDMAMAVEIYEDTLPLKQVKNKRFITVAATQSVDVKFFPQDLAEQTKVIGEETTKYYNLFDPTRVTMTGMADGDVTIKLLKTTEEELNKNLPIGHSYDKTQVDELLASGLPDSTIIARFENYEGPIIITPELTSLNMTLGNMRQGIAAGSIRLIGDRYYSSIFIRVQHANMLSISNSVTDYDDGDDTYSPITVNIRVTENKAAEPIKALFYLTEEGQFDKLTAAGFNTTNMVDLFKVDDPELEFTASPLNYAVNWPKPAIEYRNKEVALFVKYDIQQVDELIDNPNVPDDSVVLLSKSSSGDVGYTKEQFTALVTGNETKVIDNFYVMRVNVNTINSDGPINSQSDVIFIFGGTGVHIPLTFNIDIQLGQIVLPPVQLSYMPLTEAEQAELRTNLEAKGNIGNIAGWVPFEDWKPVVTGDDVITIATEDLDRGLMFAQPAQLFAISKTQFETDCVQSHTDTAIGTIRVGEEPPVDITVQMVRDHIDMGYIVGDWILLDVNASFFEESGEVKHEADVWLCGETGGFGRSDLKAIYKYSFKAPAALDTKLVTLTSDEYATSLVNNGWVVGTTVADYQIADYEKVTDTEYNRIIRVGQETVDGIMGLHISSKDFQDYLGMANTTVIGSVDRGQGDGPQPLTIGDLYAKAVPVREESRTVAFVLPVLTNVKADGETSTVIISQVDTDNIKLNGTTAKFNGKVDTLV